MTSKISKACKVLTEQLLSKCWEYPWEYTSQTWEAQQGTAIIGKLSKEIFEGLGKIRNGVNGQYYGRSFENAGTPLKMA